MIDTEIRFKKSDRDELDRYFKLVMEVAKKAGFSRDSLFTSLEHFVHAHGKRFHRRVSHASTPNRQCYKNATWMAITNRNLIYCEGYALNLIPVLHAWCMDESGAVVDPTWGVGRAYMGVAFKTSFVQQQMQVTKTYGLLEWPGMTYILKAKESDWKADV